MLRKTVLSFFRRVKFLFSLLVIPRLFLFTSWLRIVLRCVTVIHPDSSYRIYGKDGKTNKKSFLGVKAEGFSPNIQTLYNLSILSWENNNVRFVGRLSNYRMYRMMDIDKLKNSSTVFTFNTKNSSMNQVNELFLLNKAAFNLISVEDCRVIECANEKFLLGNVRYDCTPNKVRPILFHICEKHDSVDVVNFWIIGEELVEKPPPFALKEKNWTAISSIDGDYIDFIKSHEKGEVLRFHLQEKRFENLGLTLSNQADGIGRSVPIRIPSQPLNVKIGGESFLFSIGHIKLGFDLKTRYGLQDSYLIHGVLLSSVPPYSVMKISKPISFGVFESFCYPFQLQRVNADCSQVSISLNIGDSFNKIVVCNLDRLLQTMFPELSR